MKNVLATNCLSSVLGIACATGVCIGAAPRADQKQSTATISIDRGALLEEVAALPKALRSCNAFAQLEELAASDAEAERYSLKCVANAMEKRKDLIVRLKEAAKTPTEMNLLRTYFAEFDATADAVSKPTFEACYARLMAAESALAFDWA